MTQKKKNLIALPIILLFLTTVLCHLNAQEYVSPRLIVEEDFSDSLINGYGDGTWGIYGHAKLAAVNDRAGIPFGIVRKTGDGVGTGWDATASWYPNGTKRDIYMCKEFDVQVLRFIGFSDAAGQRVAPTYGVEVAMLEDKSGAPWGHDLSFEAQQTFIKQGAPEGPLQLDANVLNSDHVYINGTRYAHHSAGRETAETLGNTYESLVIWRNRPGGYPNIEQWGALNRADYDLNFKMESEVEPIVEDYLVFNHIQITLFDNVKDVTTNNTLFRTGYDNSNAQVGLSFVHFGITKNCDFNLDYVVDNADADTLIKYLGETNAHIRNGDANNDQLVDARDAKSLTGFWTGTPAAASVSSSYNSANGNITLDLSGVSYIEINGSANTFTGVAPNLSSLPHNALFQTDSSIVLFTTDVWNANNVNLGNIANTGLSTGSMSITFNYKSSDLGHGISIPMGGSIAVGLEPKEESTASVWVDGLHFSIPASSNPILCQIFDQKGTILFEQKTSPFQEVRVPENPVRFRIIRLTDLSSGHVVGIKKYFATPN